MVLNVSCRSTSATVKRRQKSPAVVGSGIRWAPKASRKALVDPQGVQIFETGAVGQQVIRDGQHMVGFVIGQMPLEQDEVGVDIVDQTGMASQQEHGADAGGTEDLDAIGQFIVDIAGGHHRFLAFRPGRFSMRLRTLCLRSLRILRLRSRVLLLLRFRVFLGIV